MKNWEYNEDSISQREIFDMGYSTISEWLNAHWGEWELCSVETSFSDRDVIRNFVFKREKI